MYIPSFRRKKNGLPVLKKDEIDIIAENFILDFNPEVMQTPMAVNIDSFALNYLGMDQDFQYLSHCGVYLGMTVFFDTDSIPVYNPELKRVEFISAKAKTVIIDTSLIEKSQRPRYRFTMGHECGHEIFHTKYFQNMYSQLSLFNDYPETSIPFSTNGKTKPISLWDDKDTMEWQANYLSAALLMPKSMVFKLIASLYIQKNLIDNETYVLNVSSIFDVSHQAAENRLKSLGIL